jgi:ABC-2 type transport system ATP-binding protein
MNDMSERTEPILVIDGLRKNFGRVSALKGIDVRIEKPGVYGFLGPNGAGKTTTFKCICGLLRPSGGRVLVDGIDVRTDTKAAMKRIGVQFDAPAFYPFLSGSENLTVFATWVGTGCETKIPGLLELVGLGGAGGKRVAEYSWGMKQRLGLASALLADPMLILMDEPTNGLDPAGIADVRALLPKLAYEEGRTVFLSSHRMDEVEQVCDRVIIIHEGSIVADGTLAELAAGDTVIEIHCRQPEQAIEALGRRTDVATIKQTGARKIQLTAPGVSAAEINRYLVGESGDIEQVFEKRESLEEVFFRLTGIGGGNDE